MIIDKAGQPFARIVPADDWLLISEQRRMAFGFWKDLIPDLDWEGPAYTEAEWDRILDADDNLLT